MEDPKVEWLACRTDFAYFVDHYCQIYDATKGEWIPFELWPDQVMVADELVTNRLVVILKARQLGQTWLVLCYILWLMIFHPIVTILLFSRRETEAIYLLDKRLKGIYQRLPEWMMVRTIVSDSSHIWELSNGSVAYAFPSTAGDSYTASLAFVDEADLVQDLDTLMLSVKPTIDGGGRMILLSRSNKETPNSAFKKLFLSAWNHLINWKGIFLPWYSRPERTQQWYDDQRNDFLSRTGSEDGLFEQYPATPEEALAPNSISKRLPFAWLQRCYVPKEGKKNSTLIPNFITYKEPEILHTYIVSADPAEGNPTSDDSSAHVLDEITLEEVGILVGKLEPTTFAGYLLDLSELYNGARIMVERNNHGHAVIATIKEREKDHLLMRGIDGKPGWLETAKSKALLYSEGAKLFKDGVVTLHSNTTFMQLASIEGNTLKAPDGEFDDQAVSYVLGIVAGAIEPAQGFNFRYGSIRSAPTSRSSLRNRNRLNTRGHRRTIGSIG